MSIYGLFSRTCHAFGQAIQLLGPSTVECPFCGKTIKSSSQPKASDSPLMSKKFMKTICQSCWLRIPWLTVIRCHVCGRGIDCRDCARRADSQIIANRSAVQYSNMMREWLAQYKYRGNERLEPLLAEMMIPVVQSLSNAIMLRTSESFHWDAITYVPVSSERAEERGFNQAERLATILAQHFRIPLVNLLVRERHSDKQSFKSRSERLRNTRSLFKVNLAALKELYDPNKHLSSHNIRLLVVDDIYTTGSTIQACAAALHSQAKHSLDIYSVTWARS